MAFSDELHRYRSVRPGETLQCLVISILVHFTLLVGGKYLLTAFVPEPKQDISQEIPIEIVEVPPNETHIPQKTSRRAIKDSIAGGKALLKRPVSAVKPRIDAHKASSESSSDLTALSPAKVFQPEPRQQKAKSTNLSPEQPKSEPTPLTRATIPPVPKPLTPNTELPAPKVEPTPLTRATIPPKPLTPNTELPAPKVEPTPLTRATIPPKPLALNTKLPVPKVEPTPLTRATTPPKPLVLNTKLPAPKVEPTPLTRATTPPKPLVLNTKLPAPKVEPTPLTRATTPPAPKPLARKLQVPKVEPTPLIRATTPLPKPLARKLQVPKVEPTPLTRATTPPPKPLARKLQVPKVEPTPLARATTPPAPKPKKIALAPNTKLPAPKVESTALTRATTPPASKPKKIALAPNTTPPLAKPRKTALARATKSPVPNPKNLGQSRTPLSGRTPSQARSSKNTGAASLLGGTVSVSSRNFSGDYLAALPNSNRDRQAPPGIDAQSQDIDITSYLNQLQQQVRQQWLPGLSQSSRRTVLHFSISRSGQLSNLELAETSGFSVTDRAAINAIQRAAPFAPLPTGYPNNYIQIQFTFNINVYGELNLSGDGGQ